MCSLGTRHTSIMAETCATPDVYTRIHLPPSSSCRTPPRHNYVPNSEKRASRTVAESHSSDESGNEGVILKSIWTYIRLLVYQRRPNLPHIDIVDPPSLLSTLLHTSMSPSSQTLSYTNLIAFSALILINFLSTIPSSSVSHPPQNLLGTTPIGTVSDAYPTPITPARFTFTIWGLIYVCLAVYVVAQCIYPEWLALVPTTVPTYSASPVFRTILPYLFTASCVLNIGWILVFTQLPVHSGSGTSGLPLAIVSTIMLVALTGCVYGWMVGLSQAVALAHGGPRSVVGTVALLGAVLYCAWTTIASVLNVWTCISSARGSDVTDNTTGAVVTLGLLALGFGGLLGWSYQNEFPPRASWARVAFAAVFVWAVVGVLMKNRNGMGRGRS